MSGISAEELYQLVRSNPRYWEAVRRFLQYGEFPPELAGQHFPNLERVAADIKKQLRKRENKP